MALENDSCGCQRLLGSPNPGWLFQVIMRLQCLTTDFLYKKIHLYVLGTAYERPSQVTGGGWKNNLKDKTWLMYGLKIK